MNIEELFSGIGMVVDDQYTIKKVVTKSFI